MTNVHPTAILGEGVELGAGNVIGPYVVIIGPARIGDGNWIGPHVVIGTPAEIRDADHGTDIAQGGVGSGVVIGSNNVLREYTTVHQGHYAQTRLGDSCYLMNKVYVGHDNDIGDGVTMASSATLGGHVHVGPSANLGMGVIVHQRRLVGPGAMVGMGAVVTRDVPPYAMAFGNPCRIRGANQVGMRRAGVDEVMIKEMERAYSAGRLPLGRQEGEDSAILEAWMWWKQHTEEHG